MRVRVTWEKSARIFDVRDYMTGELIGAVERFLLENVTFNREVIEGDLIAWAGTVDKRVKRMKEWGPQPLQIRLQVRGTEAWLRKTPLQWMVLQGTALNARSAELRGAGAAYGWVKFNPISESRAPEVYVCDVIQGPVIRPSGPEETIAQAGPPER